MNERQRVALANPCARAYQTFDHKFWTLLFVKGRTISSIITCNK